MTVTFFGHADFLGTEEYEQKILAFLEKKVGDEPADMYLGGYGNFDAFAYACCEKYKKTHPKISLIFVTPYLTSSCLHDRLHNRQKGYDFVIYPEIENKPKRYAITYRNQYMIDKADYVVCYVLHSWGGAYAAYKYAKRKGREIYKLADFEE